MKFIAGGLFSAEWTGGGLSLHILLFESVSVDGEVMVSSEKFCYWGPLACVQNREVTAHAPSQFVQPIYIALAIISYIREPFLMVERFSVSFDKAHYA